MSKKVAVAATRAKVTPNDVEMACEVVTFVLAHGQASRARSVRLVAEVLSDERELAAQIVEAQIPADSEHVALGDRIAAAIRAAE